MAVKKLTTRVVETEIGEGRYEVTYPAVDRALQTQLLSIESFFNLF